MSLRKSQDKTPEVKITDESATGNSEKRSTTFPSPTRRSSRLRRNDSVEILDDEPSAQSNAFKRLSFADVAESPKNSKAVTPKSPVKIQNLEPSSQSNASKRLSFADVAESPKNSQAVTHKSPVKVQSHDNDEPPSAVESSDEEEPSPQSKASKRFSFTDTVGSPKKSQTGTPQSMGKSPKEVQNVDDDDEPPNTIESSDEEPLEKSNTSKKPSPKKSQDMTPEVKTTNESADRSSGKRSTTFTSPTRQSPRLRQSVSVEILDDEPSAQSNASKRLSFADVAESPKNSQAGTLKANVDKNESPRTVESSDEEESSQQSNASNRFSFTDMINSPKKSQTGTPKSPSKVENLDNDELPRDFESSDEEVEKSNISKKLSTATSPKKSLDKTPEVEITDESATRNSGKRLTTFLSPTRRSSRLKQSDSEEILDDELFHQSNASKRISFSDTVDSLKKSQNGTPKSPVKIQSLDNDEPQSAVESSDEEEPSQQPKSSVSKRLSFADTVDSPKKSQTRTPQSMGKSPKEVQNVDDDDESPKTIESSDEEALEKSNTSKKLSFSNAVKSTDGSATRNSEKRSTAFPSPTRRNDSVEIHDDEPSAPSNASKRLSLADVAEPPRNSHSGTPKAVRKSLSIAQNVDNNESPRTVESSDKKEPSQQNFRIENAATFFKNRGKNSANMLKNLRQSYSALNDLSFAASPLVSEELIVKDETDNELIWQQISMQNKAVFKEVKKTLKLLGDDLKIPEEGGSDDSEVEDNQMVDEEEFEDDDDEFEEIEEDEPPRKKTKGVDLFNIRPQDLKNLDSKLKALDDDEDDDEEEAEDHEMDDEEEEEEEISAPPPKKGKKSAVDDKFFSLSEMEKFLNEQETNGQMSDIDDDGDDEDFETDYRYKDFFEESAPKKKNGKKVRFQEDDAEDKEVDVDQDMEEYEDEDDEEEAEENGTAPVLLGSKKEVSKPSSSHEMSREKMLKLIDKIQSENLNPRSWELSGEVKADDREVNSLLQKYVEADFRKKQPPINSKEKSDKIYSICLRRFKDKLFDDVTRKYRDDDTVQAYRNLTVDMNERKSLMDVYEDKYQAAQNGESGSTEDIDPQVKDIQKNMNELFYKLDALSHLQFAPSRISEEIRMVKNMPSMRVEEVGPMAAAAADETLLAPEEISRHVKKAPKSKDERTETDKNQERRKKKRKQSDMAKSGKMPKVGKDKEEAAPSTSKSSKKGKGKDFFAELQNVASREIKEKKEKADVSSKKKKKPKDKSETAAKYKA
uniref:Uncharacterized protein n=1 Tax=Panagrolaimus sp. PS1159 TaxID=55785 RepID=A0AC35FD75_9BILA